MISIDKPACRHLFPIYECTVGTAGILNIPGALSVAQSAVQKATLCIIEHNLILLIFPTYCNVIMVEEEMLAGLRPIGNPKSCREHWAGRRNRRYRHRLRGRGMDELRWLLDGKARNHLFDMFQRFVNPEFFANLTIFIAEIKAPFFILLPNRWLGESIFRILNGTTGIDLILFISTIILTSYLTVIMADVALKRFHYRGWEIINRGEEMVWRK